MAVLSVSVVSAEREVWSGEASLVIAKTVEGEVGLMPGHEPLLALLAEGTVRVTATDGERITVEAADGFLSIDRNTVQIVASQATLAA